MNDKIAALNRALVSLAGVDGALLADQTAEAVEVGGHKGPTYEDIAYEVKLRFHLLNRHKGLRIRVRAIILEKP